MLLAAISAAEAAVYLAAEVAGLVLNGGIVWYLREAVPENKRTIINRLIAYQVSSWCQTLNLKLPLVPWTCCSACWPLCSSSSSRTRPS